MIGKKFRKNAQKRATCAIAMRSAQCAAQCAKTTCALSYVPFILSNLHFRITLTNSYLLFFRKTLTSFLKMTNPAFKSNAFEYFTIVSHGDEIMKFLKKLNKAGYARFQLKWIRKLDSLENEKEELGHDDYFVF
jgi:hypothetical protein